MLKCTHLQLYLQPQNSKALKRAAQHNALSACSSAKLAQSDLCFIDQPQTQSL